MTLRMSDVALVVASREKDAFNFGVIDTAANVTDYLHNLVGDVEDTLNQRTARRYSIEADMEDDEYLTTSLAQRAEEVALRADIVNLDAMRQVGSRDLMETKLTFYAVVVGSRPANRTAYVRKTNPMKIAKPGWGAFEFGDTLTSITNPIFVVEDSFDLILRPDAIDILRPSAFESLFYDLTGVDTKIRSWITNISKALPVESKTAKLLSEACRAKPRLRRRLQAIQERGHLRGVTVEQFRREVRRLGYDPARFLLDGQIAARMPDYGVLLQILNEDLFRGGLTDEEFAAERKTPVNPAG